MPTSTASDGRGTHWVLRIAAGLALTGIVLLFVMIAAFALPVFFSADGSPFSWVWMPTHNDFGILPMLCGSLILSLTALGLACPLALGLCCWLYQMDNSPFARPVRGLVHFMTAIPTVVYGFAALFLLTPLIREGLGGTGLCWLTAALVLTLLILPTMLLILDAGLRPRLDALHVPTAALGFTRLQTLLFLALPGAKSTLLTAAVLGFGRAVGDTLVSLMLAGNAPHVPLALHESLRTLTAHMALVTANEVGGAAYGSLFVAGILLLVISGGVSLGVRRIEQRTVAVVPIQHGHSEKKHPFHQNPRRIAAAVALASAKPFQTEPFQAEPFQHGTALARSEGVFPSTLQCLHNKGRLHVLPCLLGLLGWVALCVVLGSIVSLLVFLLQRGLPALSVELFFGDTPPWRAITGLQPVWEGIWPACVGTLSLVSLTLLLALFPGVGCGLFLAECATPRQRRWIGCAADMLAGTPSIVMGLFGFTLILFLRRTVWPDANTALALSAGCLALLVLPVLMVTTREALEALPCDLRLTAAALGLSPSQRLWHVLLPGASRGILSGVILALGRAAEDTAVIMLTGVVANAGLPAGLGAKFEALPFYIYYTAAQYQTADELERGFGAALLLLCLSGLLLFSARWMASRCQQRWEKGASPWL